MSRFLRAGCAAALLSPGLLAQQFQYQPGLIPGPNRWTEGMELADVDGDGDLDLFIADGEGFSSPGAQRQNVLLINQFVQTGVPSFSDESVARLGVHLSHAKGVTTGDVNGDGWVDVMFTNAFNTDPPFLYINRGAAQPGFFNEEGAARGFTQNLSAAGAQFGDLDDDGDLDVIVCDSGPSFLGSPGGRPHLYFNDGNGVFSEATSGWSPLLKRAHMDVQLVDIDHDWDLDFIGFNRSSNSSGTHYLMLNDGSGNFSDSSTTIPNTSGSVYEAEVGDLDDDTDLDIFFVSLSSFQEGVQRNNLVPTGNLGFTSMGGLGISQDDNEISLCDYDNDGDLDAFVGSLGSKERIWRNDGGLNFSGDHGNIQTVSDSTLDCTFGDVDNDGDYDFLTGQGESNSAQWVNKVYLNGGGPDVRPPLIVAIDHPDGLDSTTGPWIAHGKIRDQVIDDGVNYVDATVRYVVNPAGLTGAIDIISGGFSPSVLNVAAGTSVTWTNTTSASETVASTSAPYTYSSGALGSGDTYTYSFVAPGTYDYQGLASGFAGQVVVTGSMTESEGLYMRGGQYRFAMSGDASAPSAELVFELSFVDYVGNESVTEGRVETPAVPLGTPFCFGDGSGTFCPCLNLGLPGNGCENGTFFAGCRLSATGGASIASDTVVLEGTSSTPGQPGLFFQGDGDINGGAGVTFGDGLRCAGQNVVRLQIVTADGAGVARSTIAIAAAGGVSAGQTRRYQWWYRDPVLTVCGSGFNLSNGLRLSWTP
jgi:plastocyanin